MLTLSETFFPRVTSPDTVRWSSSNMSGMLSKRVRYSWTCSTGRKSVCCNFSIHLQGDTSSWLGQPTLVKELPSLTCGVVGNSLRGLIVSDPASRLYRLDMTSSRSEVVLTGKKRLRGTLMPSALSKHLMAAPTAVSSWMTFRPPSSV